jgi:hypothetical protein
VSSVPPTLHRHQARPPSKAQASARPEADHLQIVTKRNNYHIA